MFVHNWVHTNGNQAIGVLKTRLAAPYCNTRTLNDPVSFRDPGHPEDCASPPCVLSLLMLHTFLVDCSCCLPFLSPRLSFKVCLAAFTTPSCVRLSWILTASLRSVGYASLPSLYVKYAIQQAVHVTLSQRQRRREGGLYRQTPLDGTVTVDPNTRRGHRAKTVLLARTPQEHAPGTGCAAESPAEQHTCLAEAM